MAVKLRRYQGKSVQEIRKVRAAGHKSTLLASTTGSGKTHTATYLARNDYHPQDASMIWTAHSNELIEQALGAALKQEPALEGRFGPRHRPGVGLVQGRNAQHHAKWVYATIQTLSKKNRLAAVLENGIPDVVVIDECHHSTATTYQNSVLKTMAWYAQHKNFDLAWEKAHDPEDRTTVLELLEKFNVPFFTLGITATPKRSDGRPLGEVFKSIAYQYPLPTAIHDGYLKPYRCETVLTKIPFDRVKINPVTGEFVMTDLVAVLEEDGVGNWPELVFESWLEKTAGKMQTIAFFPSIPMALQFVEKARERGFLAAHIGSEFVVDHAGNVTYGKDANAYKRARKAIIANFRPGRTRILTGFNALLEGFDSITECILWARPTKSDVVLTQGIGRGLRTYPGVARQFARDGGGWLIQWDSLDDGIAALKYFKRDDAIYEDGGMHWTRFAGDAPFHTECMVLDFVDTEANLLIAGNLFGDMSQPARPEVMEDEEAETEDLGEDVITLEDAAKRQARDDGDLSDGAGRIYSPKNLMRGAKENWHDAGNQIMSARMGYVPPLTGDWGSQTVLLIYPDSPDLAADFQDKIDLYTRRRAAVRGTGPEAVAKLQRADEMLQQFSAMHKLFSNFQVWAVTCPVLDKHEQDSRGYWITEEHWWSPEVKAEVLALAPNGVAAFEQGVLLAAKYPPAEGFNKKGNSGQGKRLSSDQPLYRSLTTGFVAREAKKHGVPIPSVHAVKSFTLGDASKWRSTILAHCHVRTALKTARKIREIPWGG